MSKSIKITESQYNRIFLNEEVLRETESLLNEQILAGGVYPWMYDDYDLLKSVFSVFDCSEKSGSDYFHCIMGNMSIAISVVPVVGTVASGVIDLIDGITYASEGEWEYAGLSLVGILPGVSELRAINKLSKGIGKNVDGVLNDISKLGKEKIDSKELKKIIADNTSGLSEEQITRVGEVVSKVNDPKVKQSLEGLAKTKGYIDIFKKSKSLSDYEMKTLLSSKEFKNILDSHSGDLDKALKDNRIKTLITNLKYQSVAVVAVVGFSELIKKESIMNLIKHISSKFSWEEEDEQKTLDAALKLTNIYQKEYEEYQRKQKEKNGDTTILPKKIDTLKKSIVTGIVTIAQDTVKNSGEEYNEQTLKDKADVMFNDMFILSEKEFKEKYPEEYKEGYYVKMNEDVSKIKITETQYKRLFVEQDTCPNCCNGKISNKYKLFKTIIGDKYDSGKFSTKEYESQKYECKRFQITYDGVIDFRIYDNIKYPLYGWVKVFINNKKDSTGFYTINNGKINISDIRIRGSQLSQKDINDYMSLDEFINFYISIVDDNSNNNIDYKNNQTNSNEKDVEDVYKIIDRIDGYFYDITDSDLEGLYNILYKYEGMEVCTLRKDVYDKYDEDFFVIVNDIDIDDITDHQREIRTKIMQMWKKYCKQKK